jgi:hypothetical protein
MKNTTIVILLCCLVVQSCSRSGSKPVPKPEDTSDPPRLFEPHIATLAEQKMCDEQAAKRFDEYTDRKNRDYSSYTSHYDPTVNVCYVRVNQTFVAGKIPGNSIMVSDAFEGRVYGSYVWSNPLGKKYWEVAPIECHIDIPGKDSIKCALSDEFDSLTEKYFGTAK